MNACVVYVCRVLCTFKSGLGLLQILAETWVDDLPAIVDGHARDVRQFQSLLEPENNELLHEPEEHDV